MFQPNSSQEDVYTVSAKPLVEGEQLLIIMQTSNPTILGTYQEPEYGQGLIWSDNITTIQGPGLYAVVYITAMMKHAQKSEAYSNSEWSGGVLLSPRHLAIHLLYNASI